MLTLKDVIGLCELSEEEVRAIAEHEHVPEVVAAEMGNYLVHCDEGLPCIRRMIVEDMDAAEKRGDAGRVRELRSVLRHFIATHPHTKMYAK